MHDIWLFSSCRVFYWVMEMEESHACKICNEVENNDSNNWGCIREKGAKSLNSASNSGVQTKFYSGDWLHKRCRCDYISEYYINVNNTSNYEQDNLSRRTRSFSLSFDFRSNFFLCGRSISEQEKRNGSNIVFVLCKYQNEKNVTVVLLCLFCANIERWTYQFHDDWATEVSGRFGLINDLRAEDAIYHKTCNSNFRTLKGKPTSKPSGIFSSKLADEQANFATSLNLYF